jgi:uncharacterized protein
MSDQYEFEWDEAKRLATLAIRGLDFHEAKLVFAKGPLVLESARGEELRWIAIGMVEGRYLAVVFTRRGEKIRIITARKARDYEREAYHNHQSGEGTADPW